MKLVAQRWLMRRYWANRRGHEMRTRADTEAPEYRWHPPRSHLLRAERGNPDEVRRSAGRPDARRAELRSGKRRPKKRRPAAERQRETITGWIGHLPNRKVANVGLVNYPRGAVKVAHRGTS